MSDVPAWQRENRTPTEKEMRHPDPGWSPSTKPVPVSDRKVHVPVDGGDGINKN